MAAQPYPDENTWWNWYEGEVAARYEQAGIEFPDSPAAFRWFSRCAYDIGAGMTKEASAAKHLAELEVELDLTPPPPDPGDRLVPAIVGYVRTDGQRWVDDSGVRSFRICSWFPALRCFKDTPDPVRRQLDDVMRHWQGLRIFWHLGVDWWRGYEVTPRWPDFDAVFTGFLRECAQRELRVSLSTGDMQVLQPTGSEDSWHERIAGLAGTVDTHTCSWNGVWNEGWQNTTPERANPTTAASITNKVLALYPWGAHGLSDPQANEEPAALDAWSMAPATFTLVHGTRTFPDAIRRAFNLSYEGHWLVNQDEPVGAGPNVYQRDDDPRHLFGVYTMHRIAGQMTTFFGGHALKSWTPTTGLDLDWGFRELPELWNLMAIPEEISTWALRPGHRGDAAIYPTTFADRGQGPARCDGAQTDSAAWFVVSGGVGAWELRTRRDAFLRVWSYEGVIHETRAAPGEIFYTGSAATDQAIVIESHRA